jgi:hypothetical protein
MSPELLNLLVIGGGIILFGLLMLAFGIFLQKKERKSS